MNCEPTETPSNVHEHVCITYVKTSPHINIINVSLTLISGRKSRAQLRRLFRQFERESNKYCFGLNGVAFVLSRKVFKRHHISDLRATENLISLPNHINTTFRKATHIRWCCIGR